MADRDEILTRMQGILAEALGIDEEEAVPEARLMADLGAESIDFLDISFQLEKAFGIEVERGDLFPEDILVNEEYVTDGTLTPAGLAALKERMPDADFTALDEDPRVRNMDTLYTVDALCRFVEGRLSRAA